MKNLKVVKSILLTASLSIGLSLAVPSSALAATYTTVRGDTLFKISQLFNTSITALVNDNNLSTTSLNIGQELNVNCSTYTVQKGDTLFLISRKFGVTFDSIRKANNIYTDYLDIGQILNIPKAPIQLTNTSITADVPKLNYSESDIDLLSRLIMAEAQGESYEAKVAVGAVVINRVKSNSFPNSIKEVIYQNINGYYQFTPVVNGWIDKAANADSIKAAKEAMSGIDPTNGALFYYDNSTTNAWLLSKTVSYRIGNMAYAY